MSDGNQPADLPLPENAITLAGRLAASLRRHAPTCCDLHGRNCEPPSELCCRQCTEVHHGFWGGARFGHLPGEVCSNPDLSGNSVTPGWTVTTPREES